MNGLMSVAAPLELVPPNADTTTEINQILQTLVAVPLGHCFVSDTLLEKHCRYRYTAPDLAEVRL